MMTMMITIKGEEVDLKERRQKKSKSETHVNGQGMMQGKLNCEN